MNRSEQCDIARDLMPLSIDGVCSEGSQRFLDEHLAECRPCQTIYTRMKTSVTPGIEISQAQENAALQRSLRRVKWRQRLWIALAAVVFGGLLLGVNLLLAWSPWSRPTAIPISQYETELYARGSTVFINVTGTFDSDALINKRTDVQHVTLDSSDSSEAVILTFSLEYYPDSDKPFAHIFPDKDVRKSIQFGCDSVSPHLSGEDLCLKDGQIHQIASSNQIFILGDHPLILMDPGLPVCEIRFTDGIDTKTVYRMGDHVDVTKAWHNGVELPPDSMLREDYEALVKDNP